MERRVTAREAGDEVVCIALSDAGRPPKFLLGAPA
jgi:hypothetical protein